MGCTRAMKMGTLQGGSLSIRAKGNTPMAKGDYLTPHQRRIVKRYYEHKDTLMHQKLSETVSELYLCADEKKAVRLWESVRTALLNMGVPEARVEKLTADRDLGKLARLVSELF